MTAKRLRDYPNPDELASMYATPHRHDVFPDHVPRVAKTIELGRKLRTKAGYAATPLLIADLSCGDGTIITGLRGDRDDIIRGDLARKYSLAGPIDETVNRIGYVDLFICCETIEHLDHPAETLNAAREVTELLLLSTPVDNWDDFNPEHIWAWSKYDIGDMLEVTGFEPVIYEELDMRLEGFPYSWGIWGCQ